MPETPFQRVDVTGWEVDLVETNGQDETDWLIDPATEERWLFKPPVEKNNFRQGEDWSEKLGAHLGEMISVPCAEVELVVRDGREGSISRNLRPGGWEMQPGSLLLSAHFPDYQPGNLNVKGRPGHSLSNIANVLSDVGPPPNCQLPDGFTAFDVFAGYLILDAWIANRDRHDENWSILSPPPGDDEDEPMRLCGSYDLAGGLGFNVNDKKRAQYLEQPGGVLRWVERGTAHRFEHSPDRRPITLVELAADALGLAGESAHRFWTGQLANVTDAQVEGLVTAVPGLSDACRTFICEVLRTNRERVLNVCS